MPESKHDPQSLVRRRRSCTEVLRSGRKDGRNWLGARQSKLTRCSVETQTKKQKVAYCNTVGYPQALSSWSNISFILFHRPARSSSNASRGIHALNSYPHVPLAQGQHW